jgi:hypothetical protein
VRRGSSAPLDSAARALARGAAASLAAEGAAE